MLPESRLGWWAVGLSAASVVSWTLLPLVGALLGEGLSNPNISSASMIVAMAPALVAAGFNMWSISFGKQRSTLNIVAAILTVPTALIVIAEGISLIAWGQLAS
jgi:predicted branched-subunit amino acid permease